MRRALVVLLVLLAGCEKLARNMYDQQRYKPMHESSLFADGTSARGPVPGTIAAASGTAAGTGVEIARAKAEAAKAMPYPVTMQLLHRGQERFDIYCAPCHSVLGDGDGMVARRGFPHPPTYHSARLRAAPDRYFYDVMTNGYGVMRPYADRVAPEDRWAIVAYIRALQLSQYAEAK
ncbi:MAG: cytochrome c [Betaproteobacteria bacterium]|nr:cytochrome c [Betaproteobacteria bacterium]MBV9362006.1 cytochrome c [Betaproteobacteria bacterium]